MVERIKQIIEYYELSPASFAEQIGINRSNLTHIFSGRNQPSLDLTKKILHCFPDIKTEWLVMDVGEMFRNDEEKEITKKMINEKKLLQTEPENPDLFTNTIEKPISISARESAIENQSDIPVRIFDSREVEKTAELDIKKPIQENLPLPSPSANMAISKIVFFYEDNSFEVFNKK